MAEGPSVVFPGTTIGLKIVSAKRQWQYMHALAMVLGRVFGLIQFFQTVLSIFFLFFCLYHKVETENLKCVKVVR